MGRGRDIGIPSGNGRTEDSYQIDLYRKVEGRLEFLKLLESLL